MSLKIDPNQLMVFSETMKRRSRVGNLTFYPDRDQFRFVYDRKYLASSSAIPMGPELAFTKQGHWSKIGSLFPSFLDRLPSKLNPAYGEYCRSQGISVDEKNPIVLLSTIGRRGPSTFVFEAMPISEFSHLDVAKFRKALGLTLREFATLYDLNLPTLQHLETGVSKNVSLLRLIEIYSSFPEVSIQQLNLKGRELHSKIQIRLMGYFRSLT